MNDVAERYVRLVLALGLHDEDYVDAYYGPPEWRADVQREPLDTILSRARDLCTELRRLRPSLADEEIVRLRHTSLARQLDSLIARAEQLQGRRLSFDEESRALYDAAAPPMTEAQLAATVAAIDADVPGAGPLPERLQTYRQRFMIPPHHLAAVVDAALAESRARTLSHLPLPHDERFTWEQVTGKPWGGYNSYQGTFRSLIQINTDLPIQVSRALDLACHEGYPGHHAYNVLLEQHLVRDRGWIEFSVYALHSPQSLIAEGTADVAADVALPGADRLTFIRDTLFPLAGLDPDEAERYDRLARRTSGLDHAGNEIARRYLDGYLSAEQAIDWYVDYMLLERPRAEQRLRFVDRYRSYVVTYNLGEDLVRAYLGTHGGTDNNPQRRWRLFETLLTTPHVPSTLTRAC